MRMFVDADSIYLHRDAVDFYKSIINGGITAACSFSLDGSELYR
jgi:hypothetical protein